MLSKSFIWSTKHLNTVKLLRVTTQSIVNSSVLNSNQQQYRKITTTKCKKEKLASKQVHQLDWNRAMSDAEKIVGYPTSFLSLRWLLSDEIANVALHLRKLVGSKHPLMNTAKSLLYNGKNTMQAWGLIVLLLSKVAGPTDKISELEKQKSAGILASQRKLAEVTEMIRISHLVHQSIVNLQSNTKAAKDDENFDMTFGNKIGLLTGDYLLGHSCAELASIRNQELLELVSAAVRDFTESEFIGERDEQNYPLPLEPQPKQDDVKDINDVDNDIVNIDPWLPIKVGNMIGNPENEWEIRHTLSIGSLLSRSCQGSLKLAGHTDEIQQLGYLFGRHLSLGWQACLDLEIFEMFSTNTERTFSLVCAPVLFHLDYDPSLFAEIAKGQRSVKDVDYNKIYHEILRGPALEKTRILRDKHTDAAMRYLNKFPQSDAHFALQNIILAMETL